MWQQRANHIKIAAELLIIFLILALTNPLFAQNPDSLIRSSVPPLAPIISFKIYGSELTGNYKDKFLPSPLPSRIELNKTTGGIFDTLKLRASKSLITRRLYDLLVINNNTAPKTNVSGSSDKDYFEFAGRRIRKIEIKPLSVFGSNINNPVISNPNNIEKLLNKSHINTSEQIIRKNLLFRESDTITPLILSDNERLLRQLPYIDDARIIVLPVSNDEADILVLTKDIYSLGASADYKNLDEWGLSVFEKNMFGAGHELLLELQNNNNLTDNPGLGFKYNINNLARSFTDLNLFYFDGLEKKTYGFNLNKKLLSATTKYAGGISIKQMYTLEDLDTMLIPQPLSYNLQDYWAGRSFLLNKQNVSRLFIGFRYTNNNVFDRPVILPDSYYFLQKYKIFLGSVTYSVQKYYKTNLVYNYGRTEDVPYGGMLNITVGNEINEFKKRKYLSGFFSIGESVKNLGYFYTSIGSSTFFNNGYSEQGLLLLRTSYFSNLLYLGRDRIRFFAKIDYTRGFDRYSDEHLQFVRENGFSGFRNDSTYGAQRLSFNLESVIFSHKSIYGFRFALFGFADASMLFGTNEFVHQGEILSSIGIGVRVRNDNLVFNTFQIRLGFYPNLPEHSNVNYLIFSGEQLLRPSNFDPVAPSLLQYR